VIRVLLVTEDTRSIGEFRRPQVRRLYRAYARWYRRAVTRAVQRLAREHEVTVLGARQLVDGRAMPANVTVRYYDEEVFAVDSRALSSLTRRLVAAWLPVEAREPALSYRGVWLPDLLTVGKGLVLRLEVVERLGIIEQVLEDAKPDQLRLLSGASVAERLARLAAQGRGLKVRVLSRAPMPHLFARIYAALFPRENRLRLRALLRQRRRPPAAVGDGRRILFVTCRSRHHLIVDPLVEAMRAAGAAPCLVAQSDEDPELVARVRDLRAGGVPTAYLMDYLSPARADKLVRRYRPLMRQALRRAERDPGLAARVSLHGVSLWPVLRPFLAASAEASLLAALLLQEAAFRALRAVQPDAVVITSDRRLGERAMAFAARALDIPSLLYSGTLVLSRDRTNAFDIGDRLAVIGEHLRESLIREEDIEAERVSVVGDPRSNAARLVPPARLRAEVRRDFGFQPDRGLVVLVSKYVSLLFSPEEREALFKTMQGAARQLDGIDVVVKVHPNEDIARLREQMREWGWPEAILTKEYDIHRLFGAADAAVMVTSMAGLEAMALGCPVVAVQTAGKDFEGEYMPPYVSQGSIPRVDLGDPGGLAAVLRRLLEDGPEREAVVERGRAFSASYIHPVDGRLAERLLVLTDEIRAARFG